LEPIKGNSFASLSFDSLNQIAMAANLKIGSNNSDTSRLTNNLMQVDKEQYEQFVGTNPETLLLDNLDDDSIMSTVPLEGIVTQEFVSTPKVSVITPRVTKTIIKSLKL
jgi:hypothetical protein